MVKSKNFIESLKSINLYNYLMVPCSVFKSLNSWMLKNNIDLIYPPNEAHAMGFAAGIFLASGRPAVIFLQNSGLNNIDNAQTSLNKIYDIPVILFVSWRGEPGENDAPEHELMGNIMLDLLKLLKIPFSVLSSAWELKVKEMAKLAIEKKCPVAVVIRSDFFDKESYPSQDLNERYPLTRFQAIEIIKKNLKEQAVFISTNGFISRESFRVKPTPDFYMVGSMGHAFSIGAGVALYLSQRNSDLKIVVLDGDGGCLMHLGSLALIGIEKIRKSNLIYILLDNECHSSTGSQPTLSAGIDFIKLAEGLGFPQRFYITRVEELMKVIKKLKKNLASFIHIKVNKKGISKYPRVSDVYNCNSIAERFMDNISKDKDGLD
jgi:phosphonopyruvate decarboxylase